MNATPHKPFRVLFVCMGNICRSPAAEIIFRKLVTDAGRSADIEMDSAGTLGYHHGEPPDPRMAATLEHNGYTVTGHARKIRTDDFQQFDLIVTMDEDNLSEVRSLDKTGRFHSKIRPLVEFCSEHHATRVPDPYYGGQRGFDQVIELLEDGCAGILKAMGP